MATRKSGPVKPPVLDLEARKAKQEASADASTKSASGNASPSAKEKTASTPSRTGQLNLPLIAAAAGAGGGAIIGAGIAFGIAVLGYWPQPAPAPGTEAPAIAALEQRVGEIEANVSAGTQDLASVKQGLNAIEVDLLANSANQNEALEALRSELADKLASLPAQSGDVEPVDLSPLEAQIKELSTRLDAIAAGASADDAAALAASLAETRNTLAALSAEVAQVQSTANQSAADIGALSDRLNALAASIEAQPAPDTTPDRGAQLPLALSGFEAAILNGRAFEAELLALQTALPDVEVPQMLIASAAEGLPSPDRVERELQAIIPSMLAAKPVDTEAGWQNTLLDRAKALLALRPAGEIEGNSPEAVISRIEAAIGQRDFRTAAALLMALPEPVRLAAGSVAAEIDNLAMAQKFAATARAAALAPSAPGNTGGDQ